MGALWQDIRYGARMLRKSPGFTAVAMLTLALGVGANTAIFSVVNAVLLRPLPYPDPDRLVMVRERVRLPGYEADRDMIPPSDFADWKTRNTAFEDIAAIRYHSFDLTGDREPMRVEGDAVSASLFSVLKVDAALGRVFRADEDRYGGPKVVLLGYALWVSRFGGNSNIIGHTIRLDSESYAVLGVMPEWFHFPDPDDQLWVPLQLSPDELANRVDRSLVVAAALNRPGSLAQAQARMDALTGQLAVEYPATNTGVGAHVISLREQVVGNVRPAILILWSCTGFVLLIVCANVANLLLTRASVRRREFAIRLALGAPRSRVLSQLLTESLMLALFGGMLGLLVSIWGMQAIRWISPPSGFPYLPHLDEIGVDREVLGFALGISLLAGLVFGMVPALQAGRESAGRRRAWVRTALIVTETALGAIVLVGAGLLFRSFLRLEQVPLGFEPRNALTMRVIPRGPRYSTQAERAAFYQEVFRRIEAVPGVQSAGAVTFLPLTRVRELNSFSIEGQVAPTPGRQPTADFRAVTPGYFVSLAIPLAEGRNFLWSDSPGSLPVAIISESMAHRFFPNEDPLGKHIKPGPLGSADPWRTVVGVAGDVRYFDVVSEPQPTIYVPYAQSPGWQFALRDMVVRTAVEPASVAAAVRAAVWAVDKDLSIARVRTMEEVHSIAVTPQRFNLSLLGLLAVLALVLAAVGLYGVTAYSVAQRTREIGIRVALGAQPRDVMRLVLLQGAALALAGTGIGMLGALLLARQMKSLLFAVTADDPLTYTSVAAFLCMVALAASHIPARRAMRIDPAVALRHE